MDTAIKNGAIKEFAAIHVEPNGESQAHRSCGFFSWHRRLLIAMESYLRDQDPKFACVTIPYYDVQTAYVRQAAGECANLYECSDILQEIGGNKAGNDKVSLTQNGKTATGYPVTGYPFTDDCDDKNVCGYTVRSDMTTKPVPSAAGLEFTTKSTTLWVAPWPHLSPRDIFFYSWHAAIDMYLYMYHLCNFGQHLTEEQLLSSKAFTNATDSCDGISGIGPNAKIVQNVIVNGETMDVADHPTLGKYFSHAGSEMWNYGDVTQLGDYSYVYDLPDIVTQQLLSNNEICAAFNTPTSAPSTAPPTSSPETETPLTPGTISPSGSSDSSWSGINGSDVGSSNSDDVYIDSPDDVGYGYFNDTEVPSHSGIYVVDNSTDGSTDAQPSNANSGDYWQW
ncbi:hypothetical protein PHMEG_00017848, partial [Phytophthora megakarya]